MSALDNTPQNSGPSPLLHGLWERYAPLMQERLRALDAAAIASQTGALSATEREAAIDAAHKFAGSLGMFGFSEGTDVARRLEHLLLLEQPPDPAVVVHLVGRLHAILKL